MLGRLRKRVVAERTSGRSLYGQPSGAVSARGNRPADSPKGDASGRLVSDGDTDYYKIAVPKVEGGHEISRLSEEKRLPWIRNEATAVVHKIDDEEHPGVEYDIPEDSYGAAVLAIIKEAQEFGPRGRTSGRVRGGFALLLLAVNLIMQWGILLFVDSHVVQPAVYYIQSIFEDYHAHAFDKSGHFQQHLWDAYPGKRQLCQLGAVSRFFYSVVLFVWVTAMLGEFRTTYYLLRNIRRMPVCERVNMMLVATSTNVCIVALTLPTRLLLYTVVCMPKFLISIFLLWLGCQWLTASPSFEALVLNSVAMEFVLHIDELLYRAFVPALYRRQVADINFFVRRAPLTEEQEYVKMQKSYGWSLAYFTGALAFTLVYILGIEDALPRDIGEVEAHCTEYLRQLGRELCGGWGWTGTTAECYPYGRSLGAGRLL